MGVGERSREMTQLGLTQCVEEPTRKNNILDLVLVNDPLLVNGCSVNVPFGGGVMILVVLVIC